MTSEMASESASEKRTVAGRVNRDNFKKANLRKPKKTVPGKAASSSGSTPLLSPTERGSLVDVPGARKVWGTLKATSTSAVTGILRRLTSIGSKLSVKRKSRSATGGRRESWWFILRGNEDDLTKLQSEWVAVATQTKWKIERVSYYSGTSKTSFPSNQVAPVNTPSVTPASSVVSEEPITTTHLLTNSKSLACPVSAVSTIVPPASTHVVCNSLSASSQASGDSNTCPTTINSAPVTDLNKPSK